MVLLGSNVRARAIAGAALLALLLACSGAARAEGPPLPAGAVPGARAPWPAAAPASAPGPLAMRPSSGIPLGLPSAAGFMRQPVPTPTAPPVLIRRMRKNTVSIGAQGQYGFVNGSSAIADGFNHGAGYAVRVRYMLSSSAALGFSFENQRFGSIREPVPVPAVGAAPDSHLVNVTVAIEGTLFFHRERDVNPYLIGGFGYATPDEIDEAPAGGNEAGPRRVNEGPFLVVGAGIERFVRQRFSIDTSLRGFAQIGNSELTTVVELALGIHLYPGD